MACVDFMFFRDFSSTIYQQYLITSPMEVGDIHKDHTESRDMWNVTCEMWHVTCETDFFWAGTKPEAQTQL